MSPEQLQVAIIAALLGAVLATIFSVTAMIKMIPGILQKREGEREQRYQIELREREAKYQDELKQRDLARRKEMAEIRTDFEQSKSQLAMFNSVAERLKEMTGALINTQTQGVERDKIINANTNAVGGMSDALADMAERVGVLLHTGTPNVIKKLDEIAAFIRSAEENNLTLLMDVRDRLTALENDARETVKQVEKHISKPVPIVKIDKDQLDNPADGTPPAQ